MSQLWCENATTLTGKVWRYLKVPQKDFERLLPTEFADLLVFASHGASDRAPSEDPVEYSPQQEQSSPEDHDNRGEETQPSVPIISEPDSKPAVSNTRTPTNRDRPSPRVSIEGFDVEEIIGAVRAVFKEYAELDIDTAATLVGRELGFQRVTAKTREAIRGAMKTAANRGIIHSDKGMFHSDCRDISDYSNELLEKSLYAVLRRVWWEREEAIAAAARYLGFRRTGKRIREAFEGVIRRGMRRKELERDGGRVRRRR